MLLTASPTSPSTVLRKPADRIPPPASNNVGYCLYPYGHSSHLLLCPELRPRCPRLCEFCSTVDLCRLFLDAPCNPSLRGTSRSPALGRRLHSFPRHMPPLLSYMRRHCFETSPRCRLEPDEREQLLRPVRCGRRGGWVRFNLVDKNLSTAPMRAVPLAHNGEHKMPMTCCWVFLVEKTERGTCERRGQGEMSTKVLEHVGLNRKWVFLE
ncbi:hypothetical protein B0T11DRAFT_117631 [Plectosphaerella cucumerina]|uniref:Uncharacterized protein n=1 Tax=Plectosphaerella cucumerina TaxID=40658 RepID=A0A8K0T7S2_9PEZI|nr:hypothetical protein B0T11DRAFT_117631 [Plectosphaerella cucumerina]